MSVVLLWYVWSEFMRGVLQPGFWREQKAVFKEFDIQVGLVGGFDLAAEDHRKHKKEEIWVSLAVRQVLKYRQPE